MLVQRTSPFSGNVNTMELNVTSEQVQRWQEGELVQNVFPHLNPDEREFLLTGITPEEWATTFGEE